MPCTRGNKDNESKENIKKLIFVPQGYSYFLDTEEDKEHIGLMTQNAGPCACIIVRNKENTKMVLSHVDSGNDIAIEEFGLSKWISQCGSKVEIEVHLGCAFSDRRGREEYEKQIKQIVESIKENGKNIAIVFNKEIDSQGGIILKNGYKIVEDIKHYKKGSLSFKKSFFKILSSPENKEYRTIFGTQISFNEAATNRFKDEGDYAKYAVEMYETLGRQTVDGSKKYLSF